ncbi:MAG TPA: SDR family NAD(P)-dependent oxidoreductase [Tepidisphaeraceae bacterium]
MSTLRRLPARFGLLICGLALLSGCAAEQSLKGKVVVVTGASSGFGKGVALKMADEGAQVVLAARRTGPLDEVARDVTARGGTALVVTTDVAREEDVAKLAQATIDKFGRIDVWINNAGVGAIGRFDEIPLAEQIRVVHTNLNGVIHGSYFAMRQFRKQGAGTLINIGSVDSKVPLAYMATYNATKHGVLGLTNTLHEELRLSGEKNIHVSTVMPWAADTPFWDHAANYTGKKPRNALMDDPNKVIDAIVATAKQPKKEVNVGYKVGMAALSKRLAPDTTDALASDVYAKELNKASPTTNSPGAVNEPMPTGTGIDGGVRDRKKAEDAAQP